MLANATHVLGDAVRLVLDRMPFDEVTGGVTPVVVRVRPCLAVKARGRKIVLEQISDHLVGEKLHAAIRVMNDKPFLRAEELVGNDKRPDGVVGCTAARVADDMRVALREAGVFGRVEPGVHAGQDCESTSRRQRQLALFAEPPDVGLIGRDDLAYDFRHDAPP
jgi:hypothetical protein